jgi:hypothetical protein
MLLAACAPASAQIFKCPAGDGYSFQQAPCAGLAASGGSLVVFPNGRPAPSPAPSPASAGSSETVASARVFGRSPLPTPVTIRQAK